jgi:hypothetical protein
MKTTQPEPTDDQILERWLYSTTCYRPSVRRTVMFSSPTHIVLRHYAHGEYMGRFAVRANCEAGAYLYSRESFATDDRVGINLTSVGGHLFKWVGRLSPKVILAECEAMGISGLSVPE